MTKPNDEMSPVGVVPRTAAESIDTLLSDAPEALTVAEHIESLTNTRNKPLPQWPRWLSTATAMGVVVAALEWLKLGR